MPANVTLHRGLLLAAALLFSTGGAAIKACSLTSWQVACFRSGIAAVAITLMLPGVRRGLSWRTPVVGAAYASTMICYVLANKLTTAANTIFLQSTAPLYILLLGPALLREPIRRRDLALVAAMAAGMALFFVGGQPASGTAPDPVPGNLLGAASGVFWALTLLGVRWLGRASDRPGDPSAAAVACGNLFACAAALPFAFPVTRSTGADWALVAFLGIFQIALAYAFLTRGMRTVPALESALLLLLEPVLNPVWAWLAHGERPSGWALLGGAVILSATLVNTALARRGDR